MLFRKALNPIDVVITCGVAQSAVTMTEDTKLALQLTIDLTITHTHSRLHPLTHTHLIGLSHISTLVYTHSHIHI